ncbi:uncharacterized protein [Physcomitrium patens]|uniref:Uncharacterized protein n=1 Tax=Physcomitrium patens TaxID=3218 RepID=A0A7I4CI99_PHYPA|nr:uncharacterized protein LOC112276262 isoform X1 [Physcomitrium patens]|eukprot:XP_024363181.1 uncharacterized protein LOC112276262 isoform X1 [Physcomitrella patens]
MEKYEGFVVKFRFQSEVEEKKQAAADALMHYSQFAMVCISQGVSPSKLRLHLLKEISGMPTALKKQFPQQSSPSSASNVTSKDRGSSSSGVVAAAEMPIDRFPHLQNRDMGG